MLIAGQRCGGIPDDFGAVLQHMEVRVLQHVDLELGLSTERSTTVPSGMLLIVNFTVWDSRLRWFDPAHVYDIMPEIISTLTVFSLGFCVFLYLKVGCPMLEPVGQQYSLFEPR